MQNQENNDPNAQLFQCNSFVLGADQDFEVENQVFHANTLENDHFSESPRKNHMMLNQLVDSLCTISRGSLDIPTDQPSMEINTNIEEENPSTFKSSHKSFVFQEIENDEESQRKLVIKTQELTLKSQDNDLQEDIFDGYTPKKHRPLVKQQRHKIHHIKHAKQLIKELKRQHKYSDKIKADVAVTRNNKTRNIKAANIEPIISDKGHLTGLMVKNGPNSFKIKVVSIKTDTFDPQLYIWDSDEQDWTDFEFKFKIRNA